MASSTNDFVPNQTTIPDNLITFEVNNSESISSPSSVNSNKVCTSLTKPDDTQSELNGRSNLDSAHSEHISKPDLDPPSKAKCKLFKTEIFIPISNGNQRSKPDVGQYTQDAILSNHDVGQSESNATPLQPNADSDISNVTQSKPDANQSKQDVIATTPDVALTRPDLSLTNADLSPPDISATPPDASITPDANLPKPDVILSKPDVILSNPKCTTPPPDASTPPSNVTYSKPDICQSKMNTNLSKPDVILDKQDMNAVATEVPLSPPDLILPEPKSIPDVSRVKPDEIPSKPDALESGNKSDIPKPAHTTGSTATSNAPIKQVSKLKPNLGNLPARKVPPGMKLNMNAPRLPKLPVNRTARKTPSEGDELKNKAKLNLSIPNFEEVIQRFTGKLKIPGEESNEVPISEMDIEICNKIGEGVSGTVFIVKHKPSSFKMAAKRMKWNPQQEEQKRILMDLEIMSIQKSPYIVVSYGSLVCRDNAWVYMELMDTCLDKLIKKYGPMPENIVGKVAVSTLRALDYLKSVHDIIHRDVKPSNILINKNGDIKMCDFGISKQLVESRAATRIGPTAYISPERVDIELTEYDVRADVWSLGISVIELLTGKLPYSHCVSDFEVVSKILNNPAPRLPEELPVSQECRDFIELCLRKDFKVRPNFRDLLETSEFVKIYEKKDIDVAGWYLSLNEK